MINKNKVVKYFRKEFGNFKKSIGETSVLNLFSIISDFLVALSYFLFTGFFSNFLVLLFNNIENHSDFLVVLPEFLIQFILVAISAGLLLVAYSFVVVAYSIFQSFVWFKFLGKKFSVKLLMRFLNRTLVFAFLVSAIVYFVSFVFVSPIWEIIGFVVLLLFIWILPILHIKSIISTKYGIFRDISLSVKLFFKKFKYFIVPGLVILTVFNALVMSTTLFRNAGANVENVITMLVAFAVLSWAKRYMIIIVRSLEK